MRIDDREMKLTQGTMAKTETTPRSWRKRLANWGAQFAILLLLMLAVEAFLTREAVGVMAPPITSTTLQSQHFSLQQFKGKPAVIHFWATWCPVCELEQGMVDVVARDVPMITVAMQSGTPGEVRDYLKQQGVAYPVINDERSWLSSQYGVKAVPASFILDSEGRVRFVTRGYTSGWGIRIRLWLAGLF
jgi:peroxiredoxin